MWPWRSIAIPAKNVRFTPPGKVHPTESPTCAVYGFPTSTQGPKSHGNPPPGPQIGHGLSAHIGPRSPLRGDPPPPELPPLPVPAPLPSLPLCSRARICVSSLATAAHTEAGEPALQGAGQLMTRLPPHGP